MRSRVLFDLSTLGVLLSTLACHSMSRVNAPTQPSGKTVEVRMTPARALDVINGSRKTLDAVSRVRGEPAHVRGDSVTFRIHSWRGGNPATHRSENAVTVFSTSDPGLSFFENRFSVKKSLLAVAIAVGLVSLGIGQASIAGH